MLPTDSRDAWDSQFFTDPRVTQWWDADRIVGQWLANKQNIDLGDHGAVIWDAFLLFGTDAQWQSSPSDLLAWGTPIVGRFPELADTLTPLLEAPVATPRAAHHAAIDTPTHLVLIAERKDIRAYVDAA
jgi:hypothetical protein